MTLENFGFFETYWKCKRVTLNKPADSVVLFFHWCMIQQKFNYISSDTNTNGQHSNRQGPRDENHYELLYDKYECQHRVELDLRDQVLHVLVKRLSDFEDVKSEIDLKEFVYLENYKSHSYSAAFKNHAELHEKIKSFLKKFKQSNFEPSVVKVDKTQVKIEPERTTMPKHLNLNRLPVKQEPKLLKTRRAKSQTTFAKIGITDFFKRKQLLTSTNKENQLKNANSTSNCSIDIIDLKLLYNGLDLTKQVKLTAEVLAQLQHACQFSLFKQEINDNETKRLLTRRKASSLSSSTNTSRTDSDSDSWPSMNLRCKKIKREIV
jgi:hypothetical protein